MLSWYGFKGCSQATVAHVACRCFDFDECDLLAPFTAAGKFVFVVEYNLQTSQFCPQANALGFNAVLKSQSLDQYLISCRNGTISSNLTATSAVSPSSSTTSNSTTQSSKSAVGHSVAVPMLAYAVMLLSGLLTVV